MGGKYTNAFVIHELSFKKEETRGSYDKVVVKLCTENSVTDRFMNFTRPESKDVFAFKDKDSSEMKFLRFLLTGYDTDTEYTDEFHEKPEITGDTEIFKKLKAHLKTFSQAL